MTGVHSSESRVVNAYSTRMSTGAGRLEFQHDVTLTAQVTEVSSHTPPYTTQSCWWVAFSGNALVSINVVTLRRARLVLRWVTVFERVNRLGM